MSFELVITISGKFYYSLSNIDNYILEISIRKRYKLLDIDYGLLNFINKYKEFK